MKFTSLGLAAAVLLAACSPGRIIQTPEASATPEYEAPTREEFEAQIAEQILSQRSPDVPDLPFPDNPDPAQCGIPTQWGPNGQAWLTGFYESELIEPDVLLYDSHLRLNIKTRAPHGSEVQILLYQANPVLDYYLVKVAGQPGPDNEGWVPAVFLSFDPVE